MTRLHDMLIRHEGLKLKPYRCTAGKLTIGVGHNIEDNGIPKDIALILLNYDINETVNELGRNFDWFDGLDTVRKEAVIDMCFNLGITRFKGFKNFISAMEKRNYFNAAAEMLDSKWARQVGNRAKELSEMILTGEYNEP